MSISSVSASVAPPSPTYVANKPQPAQTTQAAPPAAAPAPTSGASDGDHDGSSINVKA